MWFINNISEQIWVSLAIVVIISLIAIIVGKMADKADPEKKAPLIVAIFEMIVGIINGFVKENIGPKRWRAYAPYIFTVAIYLLFANLSGLFGVKPPTCSWNVTLGLAIITFLIIHYTGIKSNGLKGYLKMYFSPIWFLFPINLIGEITFPLALSLRLFGNILSGVVMSILIYGVGGWMAVPFMPIYHAIFDVMFGIIQVLVFVLLSIVFIGQKVNQDEFNENTVENEEELKCLN